MLNTIRQRKFRASDVAFLVVVVVSLIMALSTTDLQTNPPGIIFIVSLLAVFTALGIYGVEFCQPFPGGNLWTLAYFAIQLGIGSLVFYLSDGVAWLILAPIASQTVYLFAPRGVIAANAVIFAASLGVVALLAETPASLINSAVALLTALVFVTTFTYIAVREERSRQEVERLNAELALVNQKLRQYAIQVEEVAILQERNRLARDIHDSLGHYLTALNMQLKAAQAVLPVDQKRAEDALAKAQSLAEDALASVRQSVAALREEPALKLPLPEAIAKLLEEGRESGLVINLDVQGEPRSLPAPATITLYRAAQEALTNIRKHALASRADVTLAYLPDCVRLNVADNGVGAHGEPDSETGFGLVGLRERVALLGGKVNVITAPKQGFILEVDIPFANHE